MNQKISILFQISHCPKIYQRYFSNPNIQGVLEKSVRIVYRYLVRSPYLKWWILRFQSIWCALLFFQFLGFHDTFTNSFVKFLTVLSKQTSKIVIFLLLTLGSKLADWYPKESLCIIKWLNYIQIQQKWYQVALLVMHTLILILE